ncbi:MAG: hypothetical protein M3083_05045 [Actinomycetota bacterium]|nr:hypothetical protein [Actinomycetota bacterium]
MPMREECKHFQSRTYSDGEVARFCVLDLAPEAPWRCPGNCPRYERRLADAGWVHGSLIEPPLEEAPALGPATAQLLDDAEDIVNSVGPSIVAEQERRRRVEDGAGPWWKRLPGAFRRRR